MSINFAYQSRKYRSLVEFIALNDDNGSPDALNIEAVSGYMTVVMVAACYNLKTASVAKDVISIRQLEAM